MTYSSNFFTFLRTNSNLDLKTLEPFFRIESSYLEKLNYYPVLLEQLIVELDKEKPFFTFSDEAKLKDSLIEQAIKKIQYIQETISKFINSTGLKPIFDERVPSLFLNFFKSDFHQKLSHICEELSDFYRNENFNRLFESPEEIEVLKEFTEFGALTASYLVNFDSLSKKLKDKREPLIDEKDEKEPWDDEKISSLSSAADDSIDTTIPEASNNLGSSDAVADTMQHIQFEQQPSLSSAADDSTDGTNPETSSDVAADTIPQQQSLFSASSRPLHKRPNARQVSQFEMKKNFDQYLNEKELEEQKQMLHAFFKNNHPKSSNPLALSGLFISSEHLYLHAKSMEKSSSEKKSTNFDFIHLYIENERKGHIASCFHLMNIALAGGFSLQDREKSIRWALDLLIIYKEDSSMLLDSLKAEEKETIKKLISLIENRPRRLKSNLDLTQLHRLTKEKFNQLVKEYLTMLKPIKPRTNIKFDIFGTNRIFTFKIWQSKKQNQQLEELSNSHDSKYSKLEGKVKFLLEELIKNYKEKTLLASSFGSTKKDQLEKIYNTLLEFRFLDEDIPYLLHSIEQVCSIHRNSYGFKQFRPNSLQEFHRLKHFLKIDDEMSKPSINQKYKKMLRAEQPQSSSASAGILAEQQESSSASASLNSTGALITKSPGIEFSVLEGKVKILLEEIINNYKEKTWLSSDTSSAKKNELIVFYKMLLKSKFLDKDIPGFLNSIEQACSIHRNRWGLGLFRPNSLQEFHRLKHTLKIDDEITKLARG